ncbi:sel1 repeat family protein [Pseudoxanthomonas kaohsiungensis]|uniref:Sel1 repeat family protein n=1 Tax=Pseudoxanthomonas kaohsiungensis TaxID=283923 RepID=A0ABW3LZ67_9GAMM|nr:sel1 repeat family protein [Pseudoxanthomonas kaohsiungensis]
MHTRHWKAAGLLLVTSLLAPAAFAADTPTRKPPPDPTEDALMMSAGFLSSHPDLRFRLNGQKRFSEGNYADAFDFFQRAAWYGDKPSQGMVAEMLWTAKGVAQDRPRAYAWMDLAAERGYDGFVTHRERYWAALDEAERARAIEVGREVYAKYGDAASEPRLEAVLRRERAKQTGSRTGFSSTLKIYVPGPGGTYDQIDGSKYYDERYWDPKQYRALQDSIWARSYTGRVDVGPVQQIGADGNPNSRVPATAPQTDAPEPRSPEPDDTVLGDKPGR